MKKLDSIDDSMFEITINFTKKKEPLDTWTLKFKTIKEATQYWDKLYCNVRIRELYVGKYIQLADRTKLNRKKYIVYSGYCTEYTVDHYIYIKSDNNYTKKFNLRHGDIFICGFGDKKKEE